ncbi:MAG TPA: hypothetical protein VK927_01420, partial [Adhaeribacter sp.]|nr:hypothetical protein [Adhaeribacter sp.]
MKRKIRNLIAAAAGCFLLAGLAFPAQATHTQGSELTYNCVAPNTYLATLKIYRDCQGAQAPQNATLLVKAPGCNNGRSIPMTKLGNSRLGTDYCAQLGAPTCTVNGNPNYEEITFVSTVSFSAAEAQCADWVMSWNLC